MSAPIALFLFENSGNAARPWAKMGYRTICIDIKNDDRTEYVGRGSIEYRQEQISKDNVDSLANLGPSFVGGFPPCTDLATSGARHFAAKRKANPFFQAEAARLCMIPADVANMAGCPFMVENPRSVLSTIWRKPDFMFHPWEYGGYLSPSERVHPRWPRYIAPADAYPKETYLWTGGGFVMPPKRPVLVPPGYSSQYHSLGGKSEKTKTIRSEGPRGFLKAVALYNSELIL